MNRFMTQQVQTSIAEIRSLFDDFGLRAKDVLIRQGMPEPRVNMLYDQVFVVSSFP